MESQTSATCPTGLTWSEIPSCASAHHVSNSNLPIFRMKLNGKFYGVLFDTGSTVNIISKGAVVDDLGIPNHAIGGLTTRTKGITGQKITNLGNINLSTELLGFKSNEDFVVLEEATFPAQALIDYKTMQNWGLIINCKDHKLGIQQGVSMNCLHLEGERSFPNLINLVGTSTSGIETVHEKPQQTQTDLDCSQESLNEVALSVHENQESLSETQSPEMGDESLEEPIIESPEVPCLYNEVRVLGSFPREEFSGLVACANQADSDQSEELGFICHEDDTPDITIISTANDCTASFKVQCGVQLRPGKLTKVHLCACNPQELPECSQVILLGDSLPESV